MRAARVCLSVYVGSELGMGGFCAGIEMLGSHTPSTVGVVRGAEFCALARKLYHIKLAQTQHASITPPLHSGSRRSYGCHMCQRICGVVNARRALCVVDVWFRFWGAHTWSVDMVLRAYDEFTPTASGQIAK